MSLAKIGLAVGIALVFAVFVGYAVHVLYQPFRYDGYGVDDARSYHATNTLVLLSVIASCAITAGVGLRHLEGIGAGLIGGGILTILWAVIYTRAYWTQWSRFFHLLILGAFLIALIVATYKYSDFPKKSSPGGRKSMATRNT